MRCMQGVFRHLSPKDFEVVVFCAGAAVKTIGQAITRDDVRFVPIPYSLPESVERIRSVACDLIYFWEVGSGSLNYLLPFARLAPIQCTSHGSFQTTTGVPAIDYFMSSELIESQNAVDHYSEKLWNAKSLLMYQTRLPAVSPVTRDYFRLPEGRNLYVCFQNPLKLHPDFDPLLREILARDSKGIVVLLGGRHGRIASLLQERFAETIPTDAHRIVFLPWLKFDDYCRLLQAADVILDPPNYSAASSLYDVLSFNRPIVTMPGELAVSRVTAAYYKRMGFTELIADSAEQYLGLAARVACDRDYRMHVRDCIAAVSNTVFDDLLAVREHERFFHEVLAGASANG